MKLPDLAIGMIGLAIGVGVFAAAVLAAGQVSGEGLYLLVGVAALSAVTTYLSRHISSFLKIFVAIFSVETIVFGLDVSRRRLEAVAG